MSLSFFYGDEEFLMEQEIKKRKEKFLDKEFIAMNFKTVNSPAYPDFIDLLRTQPMMFGSQMIIINVENFFGTITLEDKQVEEIKSAMESVSENLHIIFTLNFERNSKRKPDSRKKFYKILSKYAEFQEFASIPAYKTDELISFINKEAKKNKITIEKNASLKLVEQVGNNLRELSKEIEKLVLISYPKNKITEDMVKSICITNEDIFSLTDNLFLGKKVLALKEFRKLCDKEYPIMILAVIQTNLRKIIIMKLNERKLPTSEIAKLVGMTDYLVQLRLQAMKGANLKDLIKLKRKLTDVEYNIKVGKVLDIQDEIERAMFSY